MENPGLQELIFLQDSGPATPAAAPAETAKPNGGGAELSLDDLYTKYKKLQQQLEFLAVQEEYIKDEQRNLKKEYLHAQEEVKRIQSVPLVIGQFLEAVDQNTGIVGSTTGSNYYVRILSTLDRQALPFQNIGCAIIFVHLLLLKMAYKGVLWPNL